MLAVSHCARMFDETFGTAERYGQCDDANRLNKMKHDIYLPTGNDYIDTMVLIYDDWW
jgi:hypothetical protein